MSSLAGRGPQGSEQALVAGWYRWFLPDHRSLDAVVNRWPAGLRGLVWRFGAVQAVTLLIAGRGHQAIATIRRDRGWRCLVLLSALLHRRPKLVVLHFIDHDLRRSGLRGALDRAWRPVERWALGRSLKRAQVLSAWEVDQYAEAYGVERFRFEFVPFAWRHPPSGAAPDFPAAGERQGVIAAGRVSCDWPTLFAAARGQPWALTVVCSEAHHPLVQSLNRDGRARVLIDAPEATVQELLQSSAVSVIVTYDAGMSQGHVRLCAAVDAGIPVVASRTRSLQGYVEEDRTAILVPPAQPHELRAAINRLLEDPAARDRLAQSAWTRAEQWTWEDYLAGISALLGAEPSSGAQAAASAGESSLPAEPPAGRSRRREITLDTPSAPIDTP